MADPQSPLLRHQHNLLEHVRIRGLCTDDALAARLRELGHTADRSTLAKYRSGERTAPLGLLEVILGFVNAPLEVLSFIAEPHRLRVVPDATISVASVDLVDRVLELGGLTGQLGAEVREALRDGRLDDCERARVSGIAAQLRQLAAELEVGIGEDVRDQPSPVARKIGPPSRST